jgi:hypothetical protein
VSSVYTYSRNALVLGFRTVRARSTPEPALPEPALKAVGPSPLPGRWPSAPNGQSLASTMAPYGRTPHWNRILQAALLSWVRLRFLLRSSESWAPRGGTPDLEHLPQLQSQYQTPNPLFASNSTLCRTPTSPKMGKLPLASPLFGRIQCEFLPLWPCAFAAPACASSIDRPSALSYNSFQPTELSPTRPSPAIPSRQSKRTTPSTVSSPAE